MAGQVDADRLQRAQVLVEHVLGRRLEDHLVLVVMLQTIRIFAITTIGWPAGRFDVGGVPRFRADGAQKGGGVERTGAFFKVVGLSQGAATRRPILVQTKDNVLKTRRILEHDGVYARGPGGRNDGNRSRLGCRTC